MVKCTQSRRAAAVRNHRDVEGRGHGGDPPQFGQAAAPVDVGLPDLRGVVHQQLAESVARILVLASHDARGLDLRVQPAEALVIVRRQHLLHPVDAIRGHHLGEFDGVALGERHPAIEHDVAIRAELLARGPHQLRVLPHAFDAVGRAVRYGELQALVAEFDVLLDVVAGAVSRDAVLGLPPSSLYTGMPSALPIRSQSARSTPLMALIATPARP